MSESNKVYASQKYVEEKIVQSRIQPDWNQNDPNAADYVKGRTHYEVVTTFFEWDGNKEGRDTALVNGNLPLICVSDAVPSGLYNGMTVKIIIGNDEPYETGIEQWTDTDFAIGEQVVFVGEDSPLFADGIPHSGIWVLDLATATGNNDMYVKRVETATVHTIPSQYIKLYHEVKPGDTEVPELGNCAGYKIKDENDIYSFIGFYSVSEDGKTWTDYFSKSKPVVISSEYENVNEVQAWDATPTKAFVHLGDATEIQIRSSTSGSRKMFRITVDDSGTLTATET